MAHTEHGTTTPRLNVLSMLNAYIEAAEGLEWAEKREKSAQHEVIDSSRHKSDANSKMQAARHMMQDYGYIKLLSTIRDELAAPPVVIERVMYPYETTYVLCHFTTCQRLGIIRDFLNREGAFANYRPLSPNELIFGISDAMCIQPMAGSPACVLLIGAAPLPDRLRHLPVFHLHNSI